MTFAYSAIYGFVLRFPELPEPIQGFLLSALVVVTVCSLTAVFISAILKGNQKEKRVQETVFASDSSCSDCKACDDPPW